MIGDRIDRYFTESEVEYMHKKKIQSFFDFNRLLWFASFLALLLIFINLTGCSTANDINREEDTGKEETLQEKTVNIAYVDWDSEVASTYVVKTIIEKELGYDCEVLPVPLTSLLESIAAGDQDATVSSWLPSLHKKHLEAHEDRVEILGPNFEGTFVGLATPGYVTIESMDDLIHYKEEFGEKIIGIEPDAGIMEKTKEVFDEYNLHDHITLVSGSESTMTKTLETAIEEQKPIIVTAWTPHWKFEKWDLKYLADPKNVFGEEEHIATVVRENLHQDMPEVYDFLDHFYWGKKDIQRVMLLIEEENKTPREAAEIWVEENKDLVDEWISP